MCVKNGSSVKKNSECLMEPANNGFLSKFWKSIV